MNLIDVFSNFKSNAYLGFLIIMMFLLYALIFTLQILKNKNVLPISITISILLGLYFFAVTSIIDENSIDQDYILSIKSWLTLAWNIFMSLLLVSLPIYVFTMVSTTFTNSRHHEGGKKLLITSFLSLWAMTLMGILVSFIFIPILYFGSNFFQLEETVPTGSNGVLASALHIYSYVVLLTLFLSVLFGLILSFIHKRKHEFAENIISVIENIKDSTRKYLNFVSKMVPYVISGVLILLFNNYDDAFVRNATALAAFIIIFFLGLAIVVGLELNFIFFLRKEKDNLPKKDLAKKTGDYALNVFAVQSSPIVYPMTVKYTDSLGVSDPVKETVPTLSTFMGYSMCGGFYPSLVVLFTLTQQNSFISQPPFNQWWILILFFMIPLIMIMTLGMTGVPGADVAIILGILSILGLNPAYFFTIYLVEPLLDKFRGIGNSLGFASAAVITNRIYEFEIKSSKKKEK